MTNRMKADAAAPVEKPTRTADEQALVDAWLSKTRLHWPPRLKDGEAAGTVVAATKDMELWGARLAKALGVDEPWLLDMLLNQGANCMPGEPRRGLPASPLRRFSRSAHVTVWRPCWRSRWPALMQSP